MRQAVKNALVDLFGSKKFLVSAVALIAQFGGYYGLEIDQEALTTALSPLYAYILAQGVSDFGKNKK